MNVVLNLFDMGESPDDVKVIHTGDILCIYVKGEHKAMITGVHKHVKRDKNYPDKFTDIVVDYHNEKDNVENRDVIATLFHRKSSFY